MVYYNRRDIALTFARDRRSGTVRRILDFASQTKEEGTRADILFWAPAPLRSVITALTVAMRKDSKRRAKLRILFQAKLRERKQQSQVELFEKHQWQDQGRQQQGQSDQDEDDGNNDDDEDDLLLESDQDDETNEDRTEQQAEFKREEKRKSRRTNRLNLKREKEMTDSFSKIDQREMRSNPGCWVWH